MWEIELDAESLRVIPLYHSRDIFHTGSGSGELACFQPIL